MKLLVCGGAGFIGSNFIRYMLDTYPDVEIINYDVLTYAANLDNLAGVTDRYTFVKGDIISLGALERVFEQHKPTHIINFAAETHVDHSIHKDAGVFVLSNALGVQRLLEMANKYKVEKYVQVSTDEVYGSLELDSTEKFSEETPIKPNMPYAAAKAGGDLMCHAYFMTHATPVIVTHCSNNYGKYQYPEKLIPLAITKLKNNEKVPVYGDGLNVRDWIHVEDHCSALDLLLREGKAGEVYNIGVDNERSNLEVLDMILDTMGKSRDMLEFVKDRPGHDRRYAIDATKIMKLGWKPKYPRNMFYEGLRETVFWYLE